jgi:hypothetical protein
MQQQVNMQVLNLTEEQKVDAGRAIGLTGVVRRFVDSVLDLIGCQIAEGQQFRP